VNIGGNSDTILTTPKCHILICEIETVFSKNDKDKHKNS